MKTVMKDMSWIWRSIFWKLPGLHKDLPFWLKFETPVANLHDKKENVTHTRNLKQALNHELVFRKAHRVIKVNQ